MNTLWRDLRYGARMLLKSPGFALISVVTLALGIGANTAIFSVINAVLLRQLPYEEADRLVFLSERNPSFDSMSISYPDFVDWRERNHSFESIGVANFRDYNLTGSGEPERLRTGQASADLFRALRVRPALGRLFTNDEDQVGAPPVVVLSYGLWERRFGKDPNVLDRAVILSERPYTIIGVMPADLAYARKTDLWVPIGQLANDPWLNRRDNHPGLRGIARLNPGVTLEQARADLDSIALQLEQQYPEINKDLRIRVVPLLEDYVSNVRQALWLILGAVGLVLLIACANVANLMLARSAVRQREMAVRVALGASRWRVVRQLLTESVLLSVVGGSLGLLLAGWGIDLILSFSGDSIPRSSEIGLDYRVLGFTAAVSVITGVVFGLAPALQSSRADVQEALKETSRNTTGGRHRLRQALIVAEVAFTLLLLIGAGLLMRSFQRLQQVKLGFVEDNVLTVRVQLPQKKYPNEQNWINFYDQVTDSLRGLPGVKEVAIASRVPMDGYDWQTGFQVVGEPPAPPGHNPAMELSVVSPDYFRAMGIPLQSGRYFSSEDSRSNLSTEALGEPNTGKRPRGGPKSVIIDEEFARRHWPNESALGKQIVWGGGKDTPPVTVIGVVGSVKFYKPDESAGFVQAYFPFLEMPANGMSFVVKTSVDPERIVAAVREKVQEVDRDQPIYAVKTVAQWRNDSIATPRFYLFLLALFAAVAMVLAVVGIYGVMSYAVTQRTREIGLRTALGAQPGDVLRLVVGQTMKLAAGGVILGVAGAAALTRLMVSLLFEVSATDPTTFASLSLLLLVVALLACYLPARRATKVDPMVALKCE